MGVIFFLGDHNLFDPNVLTSLFHSSASEFAEAVI
jgi:hypothetical protein